MKKTIIEEYDSNGKLIKKTTIEEDAVSFNGLCIPCNHYNQPTKPTITNIPYTGTGTVDRLDKLITCQASGAPNATLKGE